MVFFISIFVLFWFCTGDMKFLCALYGHKGASATYPCLLCEAMGKDFRKGSGPARTLGSIAVNSKFFEIKTSEAPNASSQVKASITKISKSIVLQPCVLIEVERIIPSSLHVIQGLCQNILKTLESEAEKLSSDVDLVKQLEIVYKSLGADKRQYFQMFTGILSISALIFKRESNEKAAH